MRRLRLIQIAWSRRVSDEQLAATVATQGDLLGLVDELVPIGDAAVSLVDAARELGLDATVIDELADILDWTTSAPEQNPTSPPCMSVSKRCNSGCLAMPYAVGQSLR